MVARGTPACFLARVQARLDTERLNRLNAFLRIGLIEQRVM